MTISQSGCDQVKRSYQLPLSVGLQVTRVTWFWTSHPSKKQQQTRVLWAPRGSDAQKDD